MSEEQAMMFWVGNCSWAGWWAPCLSITEFHTIDGITAWLATLALLRLVYLLDFPE